MSRKLLSLLVHLTVPLSAFFTFILQPVVGKHLMPLHGGDIGTWLTCMLFFQTALLGGYALASWLANTSRRTRLLVVTLLAAAAALGLRLPPPLLGTPGEAFGLLASLSLALLPAVLLSTGVGILCQAWFRRPDGSIPYYLYSLSNIGSLLALFAYPFLIERFSGIALQSQILHVLIALVALCSLGIAWFSEEAPTPSAPSDSTAASTTKAQRPFTVFLWVLLSFLPCMAMMGAIQLLAAEFGSTPLSWVLPLGLYLAAFSLAFAGLIGPRLRLLCLLVLLPSSFFLTRGLLFGEPAPGTLWIGLGMAAATLLACSLLYARRPASALSTYYLWISTGGALAGLFCAVVAPLCFNRYVELALASALLCLCAALLLPQAKAPLARTALAALSLAPLLLAWLLWNDPCKSNPSLQIVFLRNSYSSLRVLRNNQRLICSHDATIHGIQDANSKRTPSTYYSVHSGVGRLLVSLASEKPALRCGVVGLGVGTLAAYGRTGDEYTFWDINPQMQLIAQESFSYLSDSPAKIHVELKDGRRGVREYTGAFDLLVIDAFSGDAIPVHLLTREAIADYLAKLPQGCLAVHISTQRFDLAPIFAAHAKALGLKGVFYQSRPLNADLTLDAKSSGYVLLSRPEDFRLIEQAIGPESKDPNWVRRVTALETLSGPDWTDDRHALIEALR